MNKKQMISVLLGLMPLLIVGWWLSLAPRSAQAATSPLFDERALPQVQDDDPAAQCAEGVELYLDGQLAEALPLLEAGFAGRESATFTDLEYKAGCALLLGDLGWFTSSGYEKELSVDRGWRYDSLKLRFRG